MNDPHDQIAQRARAMLDASVDALDASTLSRLNRARQRALAVAAPPRRAGRTAWAAAFATITALVFAGFLIPRATGPTAPSPTSGAATSARPETTTIASLANGDGEVIAAGDSLDMYEDLEFYAWLDTQQDG